VIRPAKMPALDTPRLALRAAGRADVAQLFEVFSDPEAMRYWSTPPLTSIAQVETVIARAASHFADGTGMLWCVRRRDDGRAIGTISLHRFDEQNDRAEVGYILGRTAWGRGFMSEALSAVIDWAFAAMDLRRIEADTDPRNAGSIRLLERLAFKQEGLLRERWIVDGEVCDSAMFGLLRPEWLASAGARANVPHR